MGWPLGCDTAIDENGYPLGRLSSVSILFASRGREFATPFGLLADLRFRALCRFAVAPLLLLIMILVG